MTGPRHRSATRCGLCVWALLGSFAVVVGAPAAEDGAEPGPVPLLRDAVPAARQADGPRATPPAGLGDWRLVAALGATFAVLMGARFVSQRRVPPPPSDVFEVLGTASLGGQHAVRIVRFGPKTLLVGVSSAGATTLAEIGDAQASACIAAACRGTPRPPPHRVRAAAPPGAARPPTGEAA